MIAADTSVLIAGFASWHESHEIARPALNDVRLIGASIVEAYSVLTRLPPPHRVPRGLAAAFLALLTTAEPLVLSPGALQRLPATLAGLGIGGGAAYDALIAATVVEHDAELVSLDSRATATYRALGARFRLLG